MSEGPHPILYLSLIAVALFCAALILPDNPITGYVVTDPSCGALGCSQLCDARSACSQPGMVCCATNWTSGVCDYEQNCAQIGVYSQRMSLTQYQDTVRETPQPITSNWGKFVIPLLVIAGIAVYVVVSGRDRNKPLR